MSLLCKEGGKEKAGRGTQRWFHATWCKSNKGGWQGSCQRLETLDPPPPAESLLSLPGVALVFHVERSLDCSTYLLQCHT